MLVRHPWPLHETRNDAKHLPSAGRTPPFPSWGCLAAVRLRQRPSLASLMHAVIVALACSLAALSPVCCALAKTCSVDAYGAIGDGVALDTAAIQRAADDCTSNGTLTFTAGKRYLSGTFKLSGSVHVTLPYNTTILASGLRTSYYTNQSDWYLVYFSNCHGCSLDGGGTVDGNAPLWITGSHPDIKDVINWPDPTCALPEQCRPRLVGVRQSSQVYVGGVNLVDPIFWNFHIYQSHDVTVDGTYIWGDPRVPNNDGIDIDSSQNVIVRNVNVSTCDDAICFKANDASMPTKNILIENCSVMSHASGYKLGSESLANFTNITVRNSQVQAGTHRAISIQLRDQGYVSNITFENITAQAVYQVGDWWGAAEALYITSIPRYPTTKVGSISGVKVLNLNVTSENGMVLVGMPDTPIQNVSIVNTSMRLQNMTSWPGGFMDLRPGILGKREGTVDSGIYIENVQQLQLQNLQMTWTNPARPTWGNSFTVSNHSLSAMTSEGFSMLDHRTS